MIFPIYFDNIFFQIINFFDLCHHIKTIATLVMENVIPFFKSQKMIDLLSESVHFR